MQRIKDSRNGVKGTDGRRSKDSPGTEPERIGADTPDETPGGTTRLMMLLEWAAALVPPVTVLTALGVWYGYELALARGRYFGLDPTVIDFSTREYVFRSVVAVLGPMLVLLVIMAGLLWWHLAVQWALHGHAGGTRLKTAVGVIGLALVISGAVLTIWGLRAVSSPTVLPEYPVLRTLLIGAGVLGITYGAWMVRESRPVRPGPRPPRVQSRAGAPDPAGSSRLWQHAGYGVAVSALVVSVFWAFSVSAEQRGMQDSADLYRTGFARLPRVVVYSSTSLAIDGPGITRDPVTDRGSTYRWRYSGLRLLVRSNERYFMVPAGWEPGKATAVVLDETPGLRFEFQEPEAQVPSNQPGEPGIVPND